jgi:hypothetical protein
MFSLLDFLYLKADCIYFEDDTRCRKIKCKQNLDLNTDIHGMKTAAMPSDWEGTVTKLDKSRHQLIE